MKIRSWDKVVITAWKDKKKEWKVLAVDTKTKRVIVEGVNIVTRHIKKQWTTPGQIVKVEKSIDISNVSLKCPTTGKQTRIWISIENWKKVRISKKSGKSL